MQENLTPDIQSITFRNARSDDLPKLIELLHDDPIGKTREKIGEKSLQHYQKALNAIQQDDNAHIIVANFENKIVGMAQVNFIAHLTYQGGMRAQIEGVRVDHQWRNLGLEKNCLNILLHWPVIVAVILSS